MTEQKDEFLEKLQTMISKIMPHMPPYRYWQATLNQLEPHRHRGFSKRLHKKDNRMYGFTTETCLENGKPRYYAFVYRIKKTKGNVEHLKLVRKRVFARRNKAKSKAYHWYCQRIEQLKQKELLKK